MNILDTRLSQVEQCKQDIKQALINKEVDMTNVPFTEYASKIGELKKEEKVWLLVDGVIQNDTIKLISNSPGRATQQDGYLYLDDTGNKGGSAYIQVQNVDFSQYDIVVIDSECPRSNYYYPIKIFADSSTVTLSSYSRKTSFYGLNSSFKIGCDGFENGDSTFKLYNMYLLKL